MLRLRASWASTSIRCVYGEIAGQANKRPRTPRWIKEPVSLVQRLQDAPRPGAVPKFTVEQRAQMAAVACEAPAKTGRPHQPVDRSGNRRRTQATRDCPADFASACGSAPKKGGFQPHRFRYWLTEEEDPQREEKIVEGCACLCPGGRAGQTGRTHDQHG